MTTPQPDPPRGPAGMPAHLWDLACSDVRMSVPERIRGAVANGMNAPEGVRRIAARIAAVGAAVGVPAALIGIGASADGFGVSDAPVDLAGGEAPLDGLDPAPPHPGSESSGHDAGPHSVHYDVGPGGGHASQTTTGEGDVGAGIGTTWHVQEPGADDGHWLTVQIFQDVSVTETANGMFVVDAYQYIVIRDDRGHEYVYKEHFQVTVPDPPGQETDLVIHERGYVHVTENPDGSFAVDASHHGIDVTTTADGDGHDEVSITQDQGVKITDKDHHDGSDVRVDLGERATSTSDDTGDEATTTIKQGQVVTDKDLPPEPTWKETTGSGASKESSGQDGAGGSHGGTAGPDRTGDPAGAGGHGGDRSDPFGADPAGRQTTGAPAAGGNPGPVTSPVSSGPVTGGSTAGAAGGSTAAAGNTAARVADAAPLTSTIAVAAPVAATATWQAQPAAPEVGVPHQAASVHPVADTGAAAGAGADRPADDTSSPFAGGKPPTGHEPFEPGTPPDAAAGTHPTTGEPHAGHVDPGHVDTGHVGTGTEPDGGTANTGSPEHEPTVDQTPNGTTPADHETTGRPDDHAGGDTVHTGTGADGADHALVS